MSKFLENKKAEYFESKEEFRRNFKYVTGFPLAEKEAELFLELVMISRQNKKNITLDVLDNISEKYTNCIPFVNSNIIPAIRERLTQSEGQWPPKDPTPEMIVEAYKRGELVPKQRKVGKSNFAKMLERLNKDKSSEVKFKETSDEAFDGKKAEPLHLDEQGLVAPDKPASEEEEEFPKGGCPIEK